MKIDVEFDWWVFLPSLDGDVKTTISTQACKDMMGDETLYFMDLSNPIVDIEPGFGSYRSEIMQQLREDEDLSNKARSYFI